MKKSTLAEATTRTATEVTAQKRVMIIIQKNHMAGSGGMRAYYSNMSSNRWLAVRLEAVPQTPRKFRKDLEDRAPKALTA